MTSSIYRSQFLGYNSFSVSKTPNPNTPLLHMASNLVDDKNKHTYMGDGYDAETDIMLLRFSDINLQK